MGWRRRRRGERHYAYENVLKEVWFMYALDADSITGQWLKWDLSRNTEATWWNSVSLLAIRAARETTDRGSGKKGGEKKQETDRGGIFTTWTHTPHPQGESKLQSALQERRQRITDRRSPERWVGEKERRNRWKGKCECVFLENCGQLWTLLISVCVCVSSFLHYSFMINQINYLVQHDDHEESILYKVNLILGLTTSLKWWFKVFLDQVNLKIIKNQHHLGINNF